QTETNKRNFRPIHTVLVPSEFTTDDFQPTTSPLMELATVDPVVESVESSGLMEQQQAKKRKQDEESGIQSIDASKNKKMASKSNAAVVGTDSKICSVCGDKARGCNFNAIACESCKAFFRR